MNETTTLTPSERWELAEDMRLFLEAQAIESIDDLADVVGIALRCILGGYQMEQFIRSFALRTIRL